MQSSAVRLLLLSLQHAVLKRRGVALGFTVLSGAAAMVGSGDAVAVRQEGMAAGAGGGLVSAVLAAGQWGAVMGKAVTGTAAMVGTNEVAAAADGRGGRV